MHFSDYIKATLMAIIDEIAADPRKFVVNPGKDFTRNRKMGFRDTLLMLLTMEGDCIRSTGILAGTRRLRQSLLSIGSAVN